MVDGISAALDVDSPKIAVPLPALMGAAMVIENVCRPVGVQPPLHRRRMNFFVKSFRFSGEGAREKLGFEPKIAFGEGARRTAMWYQDAGLL
jgi:nucleoside-diphosphate-sugar epimerase